MTLFKSAFPLLSHKSAPVVATNTSLDTWCHQLPIQPSRFVRKVDMCTARAWGQDAWGTPVGKFHQHTLLRVSLFSTSGGPDTYEDTLLIERVLSTGGSYHSVTPIAEEFSTGGTLFHPDVHDRMCGIAVGPSTAIAHHLQVERTLAFGEGSSEPHLTLAQLALILDFVSRTTMMICAGGDCKFQSRSFAFTCLAALAPSLPPSTLMRREGMKDVDGAEVLDDSIFELGAEAFLGQVPWLVKDPASLHALRLIGVLKDEPQKRATARLYH
ncbi:hypothetical protein J3R82DRAFT_3253 [Butyriboletus roseoflavus]|nr:hypothetical protein J3R82DRAFT_3253 [Butyriboletus roseoflavus]